MVFVLLSRLGGGRCCVRVLCLRWDDCCVVAVSWQRETHTTHTCPSHPIHAHQASYTRTYTHIPTHIPRHSLVAAARMEGPTWARVWPNRSSMESRSTRWSFGEWVEEGEERRSNSRERMNMLSTPMARRRKGTTWFVLCLGWGCVPLCFSLCLFLHMYIYIPCIRTSHTISVVWSPSKERLPRAMARAATTMAMPSTPSKKRERSYGRGIVCKFIYFF